MRGMKFNPALLLCLVACPAAPACELCAIYNADNALRGSGAGITFAIAEQYTPYRTSQFESEPTATQSPSFVDNSITHIVPGYNFSSRFGVNLNLPLVYNDFERHDIRYSLTAPPTFFTEKGTEFGLGDISLIGRVTVFEKRAMKYGILVNLLAGVKFPTGDASRLNEEVE